MIFKLVHSEARARAVQAVQTAPDGFVVKISEPKRNLEQNARLHAELTEISKTMKWAGLTLDVEQWKRLLVAAFFRAKGEQAIFVPALDGQGMDVIYRRTSAMSKSEMSELIDYIGAWYVDARRDS